MRFVMLWLALLLAPGAFAGAIRVELIFSGESVTVGKVERISGPAPEWHGFAQGEPLFFEVLGAKGQVIYAEPLQDPRVVSIERPPGESQGGESPPALLPKARALVHVPDVPAAREIRVCRRVAGSKSLRQVLGRGGL